VLLNTFSYHLTPGGFIIDASARALGCAVIPAGPGNTEAIAAEVGVSPATVSRIQRRLGLNRIRDLEPAEPVRRYERATPGEIIHVDIKKLGRFDKIGHRITR
jgi:hypothetical protein